MWQKSNQEFFKIDTLLLDEEIESSALRIMCTYMNLTAYITTVNYDEVTSTELTQMNCEYELTLLAIKRI